MTPAILHEDGSPCTHAGQARAGDDGFWCAAGQRVTHILIGGQAVDLAKAIPAATAAVRSLAAALAPLRAVLLELASRFAALAEQDPAWRVAVLLASEAADEEQAEGARGDPCGDSELAGQMPLPGV
jgi:hypothetical protein